MTMLEHLEELRGRIIRSAIAVTAVAVVGYATYPALLHLLMEPLCRLQGKACALYVTGPLDGFAVRLKVAGVVGIFGASPVALFQLWRFVAPGLRPVERRYTLSFLVASVGLFVLGGWVAWFVYPKALGFFQAAAGSQVHEIYTPQSYLNLLLLLMVAFGVAFLFPVVLVALEFTGVVSPQALRRHRRAAWLAIVVVVAVVIPSNDPYSLTAMAVPLVVFYEAALAVGRLHERRRLRLAEGERIELP